MGIRKICTVITVMGEISLHRQMYGCFRKNSFPDCRIMDGGQTDPDTVDIGGNRIINMHTMNTVRSVI